MCLNMQVLDLYKANSRVVKQDPEVCNPVRRGYTNILWSEQAPCECMQIIFIHVYTLIYSWLSGSEAFSLTWLMVRVGFSV